MHFNRLKSTIIFLAASACALIVPNVNAQDGGKIGVVSLERILRDSGPAKAAQAKLEAEFAKRNKELQESSARIKPLYEKLEKDSAIMSDSERLRRQKELTEQDKEFQRKQREFNEDVNQRRNEELATIIERANKVIKQVAEAEKYDVIFQEAVYVNPRVDITDKIIKALNNAK